MVNIIGGNHVVGYLCLYGKFPYPRPGQMVNICFLDWGHSNPLNSLFRVRMVCSCSSGHCQPPCFHVPRYIRAIHYEADNQATAVHFSVWDRPARVFESFKSVEILFWAGFKLIRPVILSIIRLSGGNFEI
jgi:hypothetical protein